MLSRKVCAQTRMGISEIVRRSVGKSFVPRILARGLMVALSLVAAHPQPDDELGARTKIMALENIWNNAEKAGDAAALNLMLDDAMVYIDEDGSLLTKMQFLEQVKQTGPQLQSLVTDAMSVNVYGETALVAGTYRVTGVARGKAFRREGRFVDTWVLKNGAWLCVAAQATPVLH
jgi:ketosteroid isomerase-like protein